MAAQSRPPTLADVARTAGVSKSTASRALNRYPSVDPELVSRVELAAAKVSYVPNVAGRSLRRRRSDLWAVIIPDIHNSFYLGVIDALEQAAADRGHPIVLCHSREDVKAEQEYVRAAIAQQMSGVVIACAGDGHASLSLLRAARIPTVSIDRWVSGHQVDSVLVDNQRVGTVAATHLIEQGWARPVILAGHRDVTPTQERAEAFAATFELAGHAVPARNVIWGVPEVPELNRQLSGIDRFDCIFASNGPQTRVAYSALEQLGLTIPDDVGLIGVDDDQWMTMVRPQVTVVAQPTAELGRWAGRLLATHDLESGRVGVRTVLEPELRVRSSTLRS